MKKFKVTFPTGYNFEDVLDDNIDINIVFQDGRVFFATFFTVKNVNKLLSQNNETYFWATNSVIVKNLKKETIHEAICEIVKGDYKNLIFSEKGTIETVFPNEISFEEIMDWNINIGDNRI